MPTYKGREVCILSDVKDLDQRVLIDIDGETKMVNKGEVTIYDAKEVPVAVADKNAATLTLEDYRLSGYHRATPKQIEHHKATKALKDAEKLRRAQYLKDGLTEQEVVDAEQAWHVANPVKPVVYNQKTTTVAKPVTVQPVQPVQPNTAKAYV